MLAGLGIGLLAAVYALTSGHSPVELVGPGETMLAVLVAEPHRWTAAALVLLVLLKLIAFGLSLGAFRGGTVFPAMFLGGAAGALLGVLPGLGTTTGVIIGMTAGTTAALRLPVFSILFVTLLLGGAAASHLPVIIVAAATALLCGAWLEDVAARTGAAPDEET